MVILHNGWNEIAFKNNIITYNLHLALRISAKNYKTESKLHKIIINLDELS